MSSTPSRLLLATLAALLTLGLGACGDDDPAPEPAPTETRVPCPDADSPPNITGTTATDDLGCEAVERAMAGIGPIERTFALQDFRCTRISGGRFGGTWECVEAAGGGSFSFDFAD